MTWVEGRRGKGEGAGGKGECDGREASQTLPFFFGISPWRMCKRGEELGEGLDACSSFMRS